MDTADSFIESDGEVKKLQELVKKLEKQNELLRTKQKLSLDSLPNGNVKSAVSENNQDQTDSSYFSDKDRSEAGGFDDIDVLDIDSLSLQDEEDSWLYSSPKPPTLQQTNVNLYQWVRQDFDHPSPEMESARRSLLFKLEEAARMNRSTSTPALGTNTSPTKSLAPLSRSTEDSQKPTGQKQSPITQKQSPISQKQSQLSMPGSRIDNGTFTRPKKSHGPLVSERERGGDEVDQQREVTDVEKVARQQEESLRQSMMTYTSPKRVIHNKAMTVATDAGNGGSPVGSNRSSPARYDAEVGNMGRHRNSFGSDSGTPPDSPHTLQPYNNTLYSEPAHSRRNTPNKSRLQYPQPASHSSDSSLEHQSADSMDDLHLTPEARPNSRLPAPGFRATSPAVGSLRPGLAGVRGASPQRSGLPTPRRSIPRPATAAAGRSSLPTPRKSGIPSPRQVSAQGRDENWRDGCF